MGFEFEINPVAEAEIVKNLVGYKIVDRGIDAKVEASRQGHGFQRHLIFTLIQMASRYQSPSTTTQPNIFSPDLTLVLFEEPEVFLHPSQQNTLCRSLKELAQQEGNQVLITSHSPHFVSNNSDDIPAIVRLCRDTSTVIGQISSVDLDRIFNDNQQINELLVGTKYEADADDWKEDMESVKYFMWLNPERCSMFFANHVILVEGQTECVLVNYLFERGQIDAPAGGVFVLDCVGKFNIHRFMNLLGYLNITHSVLLDGDNNSHPHDKIFELIENSSNARTRQIKTFPNDLEDFLDIDKTNKKHRKPQHVMLRLKEGKIASDRIDNLVKIVNGLISA